MKVRCGGLWPRLLGGRQHDFLARGVGKLCLPLAVAAVEQQDFRRFRHAQHIGEIIELVAGGLERFTGIEGLADEKPLHSKIGAHVSL